MRQLLTIKINIYELLCGVKASNGFQLCEGGDRCIWKGNKRQYRISLSWCFCVWGSVWNGLSEFDNMKAELCCLRGWEACQTTAVCLIELFVALKSKGRSFMQIQRKFWEKGIQEGTQCSLSHWVLVMEDAGYKSKDALLWRKGPSCAIVWLT